MSNETTLLPCPFCGGEAECHQWWSATISGKYATVCTKCNCGTDFYATEAEAIAAWNARANDRHPYEQRITGDGSDWGEIMRDAYDDLMASACESCTTEQMGQLANHIRAELGSGTCDATFDKDYYVGINGVCESLKCSSCGNPLSAKFRHCPWCGARIRKAVER